MSGNYSGGSSQSQSQRLKLLKNWSSPDESASGMLKEQITVLVIQSQNWDVGLVCRLASVCWKLRAIATRVLWKGVCINRAPRMMATLANAAVDSRCITVEWLALAKVLFFCCGCRSSRHFPVRQTVSDHSVKETRFSKTSGQSFLIKKCRDDVLYVSDPCEHTRGGGSTGEDVEEDVGIFRGVFMGFPQSKTRARLIYRCARLEETVRCPYCGCRVWSMTEARLIPKSASRRLGCDDGRLEYFVCVNGHMHGTCWLAPLSSDEDGRDSDEDLMDE